MACPLFIRYLPRSINDVSLHMPRSRASQPSIHRRMNRESQRKRDRERESKGKRGSRGWTEKERALCALLRAWCRRRRRQSQTIQKLNARELPVVASLPTRRTWSVILVLLPAHEGRGQGEGEVISNWWDNSLEGWPCLARIQTKIGGV